MRTSLTELRVAWIGDNYMSSSFLSNKNPPVHLSGAPEGVASPTHITLVLVGPFNPQHAVQHAGVARAGLHRTCNRCPSPPMHLVMHSVGGLLRVTVEVME